MNVKPPYVIYLRVGTPWKDDQLEAFNRHLAAYELRKPGDYLVVDQPNLKGFEGVILKLIALATEHQISRIHIVYPDPSNERELSRWYRNIVTIVPMLDFFKVISVFQLVNKGEEFKGDSTIGKCVWRHVRLGKPEVVEYPRNGYSVVRLQPDPLYLVAKRAANVAKLLLRVPSIQEVWLYGSTARGLNTGLEDPHDIDLLIVTDHAHKWVEHPGGWENLPYPSIDFSYLYVWIPEIAKQKTRQIGGILGWSDRPDTKGDSVVLTHCHANLIPPEPTDEWIAKFLELGRDRKFLNSVAEDVLQWDSRVGEFVWAENFLGRHIFDFGGDGRYRFIKSDHTDPLEPTAQYYRPQHIDVYEADFFNEELMLEEELREEEADS